MSKHSSEQKWVGGHKHFQPAPQDVQPSGGESRMLISPGKSNLEQGYLNPSPFVWQIGHLNMSMVAVEGVETMALADTGCQVSTLTEGFCLECG